MASNPPFHAMEDQTDEDFFDKLVDDDFGPTNSDSVQKFTEGSDSDEAKAFANLSIEDASAEGGTEVKGENDSVHASTELSGVHAEESNTLDSSNSLRSNAIVESNNDGIESEVVPDPVLSKTVESTNSGVKEVGWSSFYADSLPNGKHGFGSYSDFFNDLGDTSGDFPGKVDEAANLENTDGGGLHNSISYGEYQDGTQHYGGSAEESVNGQDSNSSQYWENMYPGWKFDASTGQWYQVDSFDATANVQDSSNVNAVNEWASDGKVELNYLQQTSPSVVGTMAETSTSKSVSTWNQVSQGISNGYPEHMVFDPQYPGWYYDTIAQEWRSLESYTSSVQSTTIQNHDQQKQNEFAFADSHSQNTNDIYSGYQQADKYGSRGYNSQDKHGGWGETYGDYNQQGLNMWQPDTVAKADADSNFDGNQQWHTSYGSNVSMNNHVELHESFNSLGTVPSYDKMTQGRVDANGFIGSQSFIPSGNLDVQFNQGNVKQNEHMNISNGYYSSQKSVNYSENNQQFSYAPNTEHMNISNDYYSSQKSVNFSENNQQFSYAPNIGISSAGRPPHALVTFGFGGKLIVMKDGNSSSLGSTSFGSQAPVGGSISVLNLMEVISGNTNNDPSVRGSTCNYFRALCQQSFPGPLVGGNVGSRELNKWIDERITNCESTIDMDYKKGEVMKLLLSLLKIACQHYGKLRSPFGSDASLKESDAPESEVAKLFAFAKQNGSQFSAYGAFCHCLQSLPSEGQIQATASEVQNLLVSGRKKEALQCAQAGQLWGPALVLASQLGDQFYVDTVKQMALRQLVAGSPLRTLCLLIAGQPADVFTSGATDGGPGAMPQQPIQFEANGMLDDWEENLAVITANRTKDDELVIIHLGDCLWKERSEITGAHICYLVAETNFETYSDSARLCLIGADHWKHPRTYASPEAIQGGYTANLAPAKLVGKLLNFFDSTAHRVVGGLPPPVPSTSQGNEHHHQQMVPRVSSSQSTMAMSSLMPSASMEPISEWAADGNRMTMHNRSVSEPDIGRTPRQVESSKEETSSSAQSKTSSGTSSRFSRFGFGSQLLQKTVGLVLGPRSDRQAKLGEKNKFYYDEKLKRWVEEGAELPAEEAALPPPPTISAFQNGMSDYNLKSAIKSEGSPTNGSPTFKTPTPAEHSSGIPPIPTNSNQFSARGRMGVRARYVDTFNQGGGSSAKLFQSPSVPSVKPAVSANAKFFVPTPLPSSENSKETMADNVQESTGFAEDPSTSVDGSFQSPSSSSKMNMQRFPSMDNIARGGRAINGSGNASMSSLSRRPASWSGSFSESYSPPKMVETKPLVEALEMPPPSSFMPGDPSMTHMPMNGSNIGDDLHEVEL
ncbi:protein transport protein SEC16B homolog isoform X2 [Manihot esculenta]|uniref:protein transport protein SEC16B homolog isoform X2 n=1 Tax=Manihot esculenta TaxID=3983 RepID=UPI001CC419AA|nr:protein transport protein SEC16B homolog isoform X2 [Manihot esculenta]